MFYCPSCQSTKFLKISYSSLTCEDCCLLYPIKDGIPLIVNELKVHEEALDRARNINPDWYLSMQLLEKDNPWRHHLKKRRLYITSIIQQELDSRNSDKVENLLDLGCGDGSNLVWLKQFATNLHGSDYNLVRLTRAKNNSPHANIFLANINNYPVIDDYFDIIFFNHVIEHIADDITALKSAYRILAPGGILILGTPNEGEWFWKTAYKLDPKSRDRTDHIHFYTAESISEKMSAVGFYIIEVKHMGWGPPHWGLDARLRQFKFFDDLFEFIGKSLAPRQASSLYLIARKPIKP